MKSIIFSAVVILSSMSSAAQEDGRLPKLREKNETTATACTQCDTQVNYSLLTDTPAQKIQSRVTAILAGQITDTSTSQRSQGSNQ